MIEENFSLRCNFCPRNCNADRVNGSLGYCKSDDKYAIASICIHKGEEPVVSGKNGICNVFFYHCNLQCIYCQNYQISNIQTVQEKTNFSEIIQQITACLDKGCKAVGFVSPSHNILQMLNIIGELHRLNRHPVIVYNTNGYDKPEVIRELEGIVDVYLPDFKYSDGKLAYELSNAKDYPEVALAAIGEMYRQKGSTLKLDEDGDLESGLIIRHLILPGLVRNSFGVLNSIADKLSVSVAISLMSQYYPVYKAVSHPLLNRLLSMDEYEAVVNEMEKLGFYKGWTQEPESQRNYRPDFDQKHPFES